MRTSSHADVAGDRLERAKLIYFEVVAAQVTLRAVSGSETGAMPADPISWQVVDAAGAVILGTGEGNPFTLPLAQGSHAGTAGTPPRGAEGPTDSTAVGPGDTTVHVG